MSEEYLDITDPESGDIYRLLLNKEDIHSAHTDDHYAASLLFHGKCYKNVIPFETAGQSQNVTEETSEIVMEQYNAHKIWILLITIMETHIQDFNHPLKRKHICDNIGNELESLGHSINPLIIKNKWKSLTRSYNKAKDTKSRTGQGPTRFMFFDLLDELLGSKPTNTSTNSLDSLSSRENTPESTYTSHSLNDNLEAGSSKENCTAEITNKKQVNIRNNKRKLKLQWMEIKNEEYKQRQLRHEETVKKLEIEERKLELLQEYN
ncbi:myb/sant-like dna-binding domain [Holotrichia oblita]|uniref:Myb/sant-like dna-binding domain n=1 Tax=Holotrichia oblita TaxID=644536 RepID=A0ACB9TAS0_HOLOL|nr:myb/sant-like dna-binding domain [Holotrichia oblita]